MAFKRSTVRSRLPPPVKPLQLQRLFALVGCHFQLLVQNVGREPLVGSAPIWPARVEPLDSEINEEWTGGHDPDSWCFVGARLMDGHWHVQFIALEFGRGARGRAVGARL
jgi:hypothetical protein